MHEGGMFATTLDSLLPLKKPKVRPLTLREWCDQMLGDVKIVFEDKTWSIRCVSPNCVTLAAIGNRTLDVTSDYLLEHGKFADGAPCGVVEGE